MDCKIVDMHCDTISRLLEQRKNGQEEGLLQNSGHLDLLRMRESGYLLQNFALFVNVGACENPWEELCALYRLYEQELSRYHEVIRQVLCYEDIAVNEREGYLSAMLTVEEGAVCGGSMEKLQTLYEMGVRMLTLTWNYPNELGYPNLNSERGREAWKRCAALRAKNAAGNLSLREKEKGQEAFEDYFYRPDEQNGLTECGREFVARMEELGMIVDVSHLSDRGFYDVAACAAKPFVASHSNARAVCRSVRNLTDEMIRMLAERGGCMGLNYCADFLTEPDVGRENPGTIDAVVRHAKHITKVGGVEVLGLGSDFDGIDTNRELPGAQSMEKLWDALHKAGFTQAQLDGIFGGNVLRLYRETLKEKRQE